MHCPFCGATDTKVIDSRLVADGHQVRRRRQCLACAERYTTFEMAELVMPRVIKTNGNREPFDEEKLRGGIQRALEKRPVSTDDIEKAINSINRVCARRASGKLDQPWSVTWSWKHSRNLIRWHTSALPRFITALKIFANLVKRLHGYKNDN